MFKKIETFKEAQARNIEDALREDIGTGSLTELFVESNQIEAIIISRENAVLCGVDWCMGCFKRINPKVEINFFKSDGDLLKKNEIICSIAGDAKCILEAERSALNFLQLLSSTATTTKKYVEILARTNTENLFCAVLDTRKTQPGLRLAQKYAVRMGGGKNQRFGLWDSLLFKENHLRCIGGINGLMPKLSDYLKCNNKGPFISNKIQVEVEDLSELRLALSIGIKNILLDNFSEDLIFEAVRINKKQAVLEVSGGVSLDSIVRIAQSGVDRISVGRLTKDIHAIDFSLQIKKNNA